MTTSYVTVGEADVAYQIVGDGPTDLLFFYGLGSHVEVLQLLPCLHDFLEQLATFSRVILFDRRGTGASDGVPAGAIPTFEEWTEDVRAVLDAAGSERAVIVAALDAGPVAMLFAAMHPERVSGLVLLNTSARYMAADDYPIGASRPETDAIVTMLGETWGTLDFARMVNPGQVADEGSLHETGRWARFAATPRTVAAQYRYILENVDVRDALPLIQAPTRVVHVRDNRIIPLAHGRYLADHIVGATLVELPGGNLSLTLNLSAVLDETTELVTGERPPVEIDRVLTTVLFTDIVDSTRRAAALGDAGWRTVLDRHDQVVREQLRRFHGREINTTGDGFVAAFDGPARAIRCAQEIRRATSSLGVDLRCGLHTGECEVRGDDLGGLAVHIAARVSALADAGEVLVSGTTKELVAGSGIAFGDGASRELRGVPGTWPVFAVADGESRAVHARRGIQGHARPAVALPAPAR
jgi:class 3 adenylate cyclase/pimeloyl-ACP methyl ester carboxylesterase